MDFIPIQINVFALSFLTLCGVNSNTCSKGLIFRVFTHLVDKQNKAMMGN